MRLSVNGLSEVVNLYIQWMEVKETLPHPPVVCQQSGLTQRHHHLLSSPLHSAEGTRT